MRIVLGAICLATGWSKFHTNVSAGMSFAEFRSLIFFSDVLRELDTILTEISVSCLHIIFEDCNYSTFLLLDDTSPTFACQEPIREHPVCHRNTIISF